MCVYNGRKVTRAEYIRLVNLEKELRNALDGKISHGYDYDDWPIVRPTASGRLSIARAKWGFLPPACKTAADIPQYRKNHNLINARGETLVTSPSFGPAAIGGFRCLILSTGFFEHRHVNEYTTYKKDIKEKGISKGDPREIIHTYPYHIDVSGQEYFYIAGVWRVWADAETGEKMHTFSMVTTEANPLMAEIHNSRLRMPTILPEHLAHDWLFKKLSPAEITALATYQFPAEQMDAYPVAKDFMKSDHPFQEATYADLPALQYGI